MPHVIIKMYPGRTPEQKKKLASSIAECVISIAKCGETSVSVAIEEISPEDLAEKVYKPYILEKQDTIVKKPGYNPFNS
jgi:4-oxalocrotonate tautomerase